MARASVCCEPCAAALCGIQMSRQRWGLLSQAPQTVWCHQALQRTRSPGATDVVLRQILGLNTSVARR